MLAFSGVMKVKWANSEKRLVVASMSINSSYYHYYTNSQERDIRPEEGKGKSNKIPIKILFLKNIFY